MANTRGRPSKKNSEENIEIKDTQEKNIDTSEDKTLPSEVEEIPVEATPTIIVSKQRNQLDLNTRVRIVSGFHGKLVIKFPKGGYIIVLDKFGDDDYIELSELNALRNSSPRYFSENWLLIDDIDVIKFIHAEQFYKKALSFNEIETFFDLDVDEMVKRIKNLSDTQKKVIAYMAMDKIEDKTLDSLSTINALENALNYELIEK